MRAVIEIDEDGTIVLKEVYSGVKLETSEGNYIAVAMRDDTLEIKVKPKVCSDEHNWWRVDMQKGTIERMIAPMPVSDSDPVSIPVTRHSPIGEETMSGENCPSCLLEMVLSDDGESRLCFECGYGEDC